MKWVAIDTETYKGKAFLLSHANGIIPLTCFTDFVDALLTFPRASRFVFYNIDYDVSAVLKHLPQKYAEKTYLDRHVTVGEYTLRYIPGKIFEVFVQGRKLECFDLYPFFQCSLNAATEKYLGAQKIDLPKDLIKNLSPKVYQKNKELIDRYAIEDAKLTQALADKLVTSVKSTGLRFSSLYSPGYMAKKYLRSKGLSVTPLPEEVNEIADASFYGARIEIAQRGTFPNAYIYDINSAYPYALSQLPDILNATFYQSEKIESPTFLAYVELSEPPNRSAYPIPHRGKDGLVIFPRHLAQKKWISCYEYERIKDHAKIIKVLNVVCKAGVRPFEGIVSELYAKRKLAGFESKVYKLILNSMFGIFAEKRRNYETVSIQKAYCRILKYQNDTYLEQFILLASNRCSFAARFWAKECRCEICNGVRKVMRKCRYKWKGKPVFEHDSAFYETKERPGRFSNRLLAGLILSYARMYLFDAIELAGSRYIGAFTDSILVDGPLDLKCGESLGEWSLKGSGSLTVIGCGVYESDDITKMRGYRTEPGSLRRLLETMEESATLLKQTERMSLGRMVRRPTVRYSHFNEITDTAKQFNLNFDRKRVWNRDFKNGADALQNRIDSVPLLFLDGTSFIETRV